MLLSTSINTIIPTQSSLPIFIIFSCLPSNYFGPVEQCVQTCARPVHLERLFRCRTQNSNMPTAEINQSKAFTRSTQTAFFIRCTPASPSARSLMYILPNRPKSAIHRMKRIVSQTQANGMRDVKGMR